MGMGNFMKFFLLLLFLVVASNNAFSATCTTTTRSNYTTNQVLTSSALNTDFNQLVTKSNAFDGGCVTDGTLEIEAVNASEWSAVLNGIHQGCKLSYSNANTISVGKCILAVNGNLVKTTAANTVTWGCTGCSGEATSTQFYVYAKNGSAGTTLDLLISTTAPNEDGYDNSSNKILGRFYNNASSAIDEYSIDQWATSAFVASNSAWISFTPTGSWSTNTTYTGKFKRVGTNLEMTIRIALAGAPTSASLSVNLPSGLIINTDSIAAGNDSLHPFPSQITIRDAGVDSYQGMITLGSNTSVTVRTDDGDKTYGTVTQANPITFGASDEIQFSVVSIPIVGWSN